MCPSFHSFKYTSLQCHFLYDFSERRGERRGQMLHSFIPIVMSFDSVSSLDIQWKIFLLSHRLTRLLKEKSNRYFRVPCHDKWIKNDRCIVSHWHIKMIRTWDNKKLLIILLPAVIPMLLLLAPIAASMFTKFYSNRMSH